MVYSSYNFGIYSLYLMYESYRDENKVNISMEYYILERKKELKRQNNLLN